MAMIKVRNYIDTYIVNPGNKAKHYDILMAAGYIPVTLKKYHGKELHDWAMAHIGWENYNWTGSTFWFNTEQDAILFSLRWA